MKVKHTIALACACALAALFSASALRADDTPDPPATTSTIETTTDAADLPDLDLIGRLIQGHRKAVWRWERLMGRPLTRALSNPPSDPVQRVAAWRRLAVTMHHRAVHVPHKSAWLCIHHYEGSWTDPYPPYFGGLQMDLQFQRRYGGPLLRMEGTAEHWPPLEQRG